MAINQPPPRGQHWLTDQLALAAIVEATGLTPESLVVEIGPGRGHLTDHLLAAAGRVLAIEIDQELVGQLNHKYAVELASGQLQLETSDCRQYDWESLADDWCLCANIPYYLTAFLLRQLTDIKNQPATAVLLMPEPVAKKLDGGKGSLLAVIVGAQYEVDLLRLVNPEAFEPPPQVVSRVVRLRPHGQQRQLAIINQWPEICRFWRQAFAHPRQTLVNNLKSAGYDRQVLLAELDRLELSDCCRPGELSQQQWLGLWASFG